LSCPLNPGTTAALPVRRTGFRVVRKAVLKTPQSKRWRDCATSVYLAKRLECGGF
jgi:hypothetical protein